MSKLKTDRSVKDRAAEWMNQVYDQAETNEVMLRNDTWRLVDTARKLTDELAAARAELAGMGEPTTEYGHRYDDRLVHRTVRRSAWKPVPTDETEQPSAKAGPHRPMGTPGLHFQLPAHPIAEDEQ